MNYVLWVFLFDIAISTYAWRRVFVSDKRCWCENEAQRWNGCLIEIVEVA